MQINVYSTLINKCHSVLLTLVICRGHIFPHYYPFIFTFIIDLHGVLEFYDFVWPKSRLFTDKTSLSLTVSTFNICTIDLF